MGTHTANLYFKSKKISLLLLAATAIVCSRLLLFFFNDSEGPNLVVVTGFALAIFLLSSAAYLFGPSKLNGIKRLSAVVGLQVLLVTVLYFWMR
ncbi:MAG TPA: hypothetical protein VHS53_03705 [Mucilaginibacter sp.]|nr:hypothetical protein [Mucilaginibacter sp.]